MRSIKIIINGTNKFKMKVSSKKAKDIRITCPEEFVTDTTMLFKTPEKLVLTEQNVAYLAGICETHKQVLNLKPIFLKRISNLQSEIDSILHIENRSGSDEMKTGAESQPEQTSSAAPSDKEEEKRMDNYSRTESVMGGMGEKSEEKVPVNQTVQSNSKNTNKDIVSILEDAEKMVNQELKSYSLSPNHDISENSVANGVSKNHDESSELTTSVINKNLITADDMKMSPISGQDLTTGSDTSKTVSFRKETTAVKDMETEDGRSRSTVSAREDTTISVSKDNNTTTIRGTRQREAAVTKTTYERDPKLFVRIISPKQRVVTRYTSYSPEVNTSPVFENSMGEAAKDLMSS